MHDSPAGIPAQRLLLYSVNPAGETTVAGRCFPGQPTNRRAVSEARVAGIGVRTLSDATGGEKDDGEQQGNRALELAKELLGQR